MKDPIVEEVREARNKHARQFNFDLYAICEDLKKKEKQYGHRVKSLPPKILQPATANNAAT
ncbi:MAG: hypothetical protein D6704_05190 [Nitrospirae bacterium]|nr:MAG: hypothetical protein D6704_05190 [Nitrospirota bacterium]